jgi:hypothetical protein
MAFQHERVIGQIYLYSSLIQPNEIRILHLESGAEGEPLRGLLQHVVFETGVQY